MSRLLLIRHGITEYNTERRFAGHTDAELSPEGYQQAEKLAERLADEKIDAIYSSDLKRALATAEAIASRHNLKVIPCPELREMDYGDAEEMTFREISQQFPEIAESVRNFDTGLSFPGGESFEGFKERSCGFLKLLDEYQEDQTVVIVSHGGVLRVLVCELLGIGQSHWPQIVVDNASVSIVSIYEHRTILSLLNDTSHLKDKD